MEFFSADSARLSAVRPEIMLMKKYFDNAKYFPRYLITQNKPAMKRAFEMVPAATWAERIYNLQDALQLTRSSDLQRRALVTAHLSGMTDTVDKALDLAFLEKYEELMEKVTHQFAGFFPYEINRSNRDLFVFEKMKEMEIVKYVLERTK